uniref:rho-related GTP-binding protein RhoF isoform X2 n=1 Tax=Myodes glareolus TaxID=447135 RepID=UPI0020225BF2|nr:rho-related GTP-binding protein RhoF isoform X2 [Myodes glareolus]
MELNGQSSKQSTAKPPFCQPNPGKFAVVEGAENTLSVTYKKVLPGARSNVSVIPTVDNPPLDNWNRPNLTDSFSTKHYAPSVFEKYTASVTVGNKEVTLNLYDTAGQEDYDRLRPLSYQNTHLVLICYDVMNPTSYDNVLIKWFPEVTHFCRGTPVVLIGCKTDLRKDKEQLRKLRAAQLEPITYTQGLSACEQMRAALYLECSAKFRENVEDVFREAAKVALSALKKAQRQKKRRICLLL